MLLHSINEPFINNKYIWEPKWDGHRLIVSSKGGKVQLYTRHGNNVTRQYPELQNIPINKDVILDAEVVCIDPKNGKDDFELVMQRFSTEDELKIRLMMSRLPVTCIVFDILLYDGCDLRNKTLIERKELLSKILCDNAQYKKVQSIEADGSRMFNAVTSLKMEGCVAKLKEATYNKYGKRSDEWLKLIDWKYEDVFISGYRKSEFGWLVCDENEKYLGLVELATTKEQRRKFYRDISTMIRSEMKDYVYVEPLIKIRVKLRNRTRNGYLRTPAFVQYL